MTRHEMVKLVDDAFRAAHGDIEITRRFKFVTPENIGGDCVFEIALTKRPRKDRRDGHEMIWKLNGDKISHRAADLILEAYKVEAPEIFNR